MIEAAEELALVRAGFRAGAEGGRLPHVAAGPPPQRSADGHAGGAARPATSGPSRTWSTPSRDIDADDASKAERDGTVIYVRDWNDQKKKVGDACWKGESDPRASGPERMKADGSRCHEADAGRLAEGQRVTLRLDAHPDEEFTGRVASIWRTVQRETWRSPKKVVPSGGRAGPRPTRAACVRACAFAARSRSSAWTTRCWSTRTPCSSRVDGPGGLSPDAARATRSCPSSWAAATDNVEVGSAGGLRRG